MLTTNARIVYAEQSIIRPFDSRLTVANTQVDTVRTPRLMDGLLSGYTVCIIIVSCMNPKFDGVEI